MAAFLSDQLDFILFFYGMAFVLLAATCWAGARGEDDGDVWAMLGAFAFTHGISEWLDLTALIVGDAPAFAIVRTALPGAGVAGATRLGQRQALCAVRIRGICTLCRCRRHHRAHRLVVAINRR